ncbi:MAG: hypothetical protein OEN23_14455 [Paracoccaceae bacterium]|nr:hypothetical protein [Paracoccaceae bacterium]
MSEGRDSKPFQDWLESCHQFLASQPMSDELRQKCQTLFGAWQRFGETVADAGADAGRGGPFDPAGWVDLAGAGGFGDLFAWFGGAEAGPWAARKQALELTREWTAYAGAMARYRSVAGAAWFAALKRFAEEIAGQGAIPDFQALQASWQRVADEELAKAQRSEDYLNAQRDLIRARLDCTAILKKQIGDLAQLLDIPTRAEIDELHRTVRALRDELRGLRRED